MLFRAANKNKKAVNMKSYTAACGGVYEDDRMIDEAILPVSYTHLDVYKRQFLNTASPTCIPRIASLPDNLSSSDALILTDVYKRQALSLIHPCEHVVPSML